MRTELATNVTDAHVEIDNDLDDDLDNDIDIDFGPNITANYDWVVAAPFRAHVRHLMNTANVPWPAVAYQAGVPRAAVRTLLFGRNGHIRPKIAHHVAKTLFALRAEDLTWLRVAQVEADSARDKLQTLRKCRLTWPDIARLVHLDEKSCHDIATGQQPYCAAMVDILAQSACESLGFPAPGEL